MPPSSSSRLTVGPIHRHLLTMTLPMIGGVFSVIAFNLIDTYFISQLGTVPLAAMGFTFPITMILGSISMGLGTGASSVVSRLVGEANQSSNEDNPTEDGDSSSTCTTVQAVSTHTILLCILIALAFSIIGSLTIKPVFTALGADENTLPLIQDYMKWWYVSIPFLIAPMSANSLIRATGDAKTASLILLIGSGVNAILDPLLIFGLWGFPEWGMGGAAIATIIARATTMLVSFWFLHQRLNMIRWAALKTSITNILNSFKQVLTVGIPAIGTNLILPVGSAMITRMISEYGDTAIASFGVVSKLEGFTFIPIIAMATSLSAIIGQNYGAKLYHRVFDVLKLACWISMIYGAIVAVIVLSYGKVMLGWFDASPDVVNAGYLFFAWVSWSYGLESIIWMVNTTFNAIGKPRYPIVFATLRVIVIYLPLGYWLNQQIGMGGIYAAIGLANLIVSAIGMYCIQKQRQRCENEHQASQPLPNSSLSAS